MTLDDLDKFLMAFGFCCGFIAGGLTTIAIMVGWL